MVDTSRINYTPEPTPEENNQQPATCQQCLNEDIAYMIRLARWQLYLTALLLFVCITKR